MCIQSPEPTPVSRSRDQLHEMMAAVSLLAPALAGQDKALHYLAVIRRGLYRQLYLTRRLELDRQLNSRDEIRLRHAPVDLAVLCRELAEQTDAMTAPLGISTRFSSPLKALPSLADRALFEEMLLALISNSVKNLLDLQKEGEITLGLERQDRAAVLTLTGGGIPPEEPPAPEPEEDGGCESGALPSGLALARQIAALHGGSIVSVMDSRQDGAAQLVLSFPLLERESGALHSPAPIHEADRVPAALADALPAQAFLPEVLRP